MQGVEYVKINIKAMLLFFYYLRFNHINITIVYFVGKVVRVYKILNYKQWRIKKYIYFYVLASVCGN